MMIFPRQDLRVYTPDFRIDIERVLGTEGNYVNDPNDPGGETNWGISARAYPELDIKNLEREDAIYVFWKDFWSVLPMTAMIPVFRFQLLDFAVQSSPRVAIQKLQYALGVADDGSFGPVSLAEYYKQANNLYPVLFRFMAARLIFLTKCKIWKFDNVGLARRIATDLVYAAEDLDKT